MDAQPLYRLLISVVRRGRGDRVVALAKEAGAGGSTVLLGRGTAQNRLLQLLCLADTEKELVFTIATMEEMPNIIGRLKAAPDLCRKVPGIGFVIDVSGFFHAGPGNFLRAAPVTDANGDKGRAMTHELITVIANTGYADDIMQAARAAGATGGTIIRARGTGREEDGRFFGITIVPEKEMLMILSKTSETQIILNSIRACPCMGEAGAGIVFCMPVEEFFPLGRDRSQVA